MTLADQLAAFHAIVVGDAPLASARTLVEGDDAAERLHVYAHAYVARIADVLAAEYPKLATLLSIGELTAPYLRAHPSRHFSLSGVGQHLARYLADRGEARHLVDLAALERARTEAFDGGVDVTPLDRAALEAVGPAAFPTVTLELVPSARVVELATNADAIWDALEAETAPPEPIAVERTVLVWRRDVTVIHRTLDPDEAPLVRALATGTSFADACELLATVEDPIARALELLMKWLDAGIVRPLR